MRSSDLYVFPYLDDKRPLSETDALAMSSVAMASYCRSASSSMYVALSIRSVGVFFTSASKVLHCYPGLLPSPMVQPLDFAVSNHFSPVDNVEMAGR